MTLAELFRHQSVFGKDVYVVDDHHQALAPWALTRRRLERAPNLITIDHHTDVYEAFLGHAHIETYESGGDTWTLARELVKRIDFRDDQSLLWAIERLHHDEHIDAATLSGIINYAFCIQLSDSGGNPSIEEQACDADPSTFYRLIRNSLAITIATEAECVDELKFDDEAIDAEMLLGRLMGHIKAAIG